MTTKTAPKKPAVKNACQKTKGSKTSKSVTETTPEPVSEPVSEPG